MRASFFADNVKLNVRRKKKVDGWQLVSLLPDIEVSDLEKQMNNKLSGDNLSLCRLKLYHSVTGCLLSPFEDPNKSYDIWVHGLGMTKVYFQIGMIIGDTEEHNKICGFRVVTDYIDDMFVVIAWFQLRMLIILILDVNVVKCQMLKSFQTSFLTEMHIPMENCHVSHLSIVSPNLIATFPFICWMMDFTLTTSSFLKDELRGSRPNTLFNILNSKWEVKNLSISN